MFCWCIREWPVAQTLALPVTLAANQHRAESALRPFAAPDQHLRANLSDDLIE